jgi:hypothetical protein
MSAGETYEEAIRRLNELQTKSASLDAAKRPIDSQEKLAEMITIVEQLGLTVRSTYRLFCDECGLSYHVLLVMPYS